MHIPTVCIYIYACTCTDGSVQVTTKQPVAWLREVLDGIAAQARRGPHKDKYELKPEYRLTSSRAADAVEQ